MTKEQDIWEEKWDYLIVLDACRFDFFEKVFRKHIKSGKLEKRFSFPENAPRTLTIDWLRKNFSKDHKEIIFVSSNPIVNSMGGWKDSQGNKFSGKKTFFKVIDVWDSNWDDKYGTVFPSKIGESVLKWKKKYPKKKFILDYMQPHFPYIGKSYRKYFLSQKEELEKKGNIFKREEKKKVKSLKKIFQKRIRSPAGEFIKERFGEDFLWKFMKQFKIKPKSSWTMIGIEEGIGGVRRAYEENLDFVLEEVSGLLKKIKGKAIITADHGEYLGENKKFGHGKNPPHHRVVREVPWLVLDL